MSVVTPAARTQTIAFLSSGAKEANEALARLKSLYGDSALDEADVIVALGGDGLMLQTLHVTMKAPKPIFGMNRGSVGFLMNDYAEAGLRERLQAALELRHLHHRRLAAPRRRLRLHVRQGPSQLPLVGVARRLAGHARLRGVRTLLREGRIGALHRRDSRVLAAADHR